MHFKAFFLIELSALLLTSAFFHPPLFAWCIFIFLVPLYYCALKYSLFLTFRQGICWGALFIGTHFSGVALFFWNECARFKFVPGSIIIAYFTFHAGLWFWITKRVILFKQKSTAAWVLLCWAITTYGFFYWYKYYSMWFFGIYTNGYCFGSPLLPLAQYPPLLMSLPIIGESVLIVLLIISQQLITMGMLSRQKKYFFGILLLGPFFAGYFKTDSKIEIPEYVNSIAYVKVPSKIHAYEQALALDFQVAALMNNNPNIKYVVMPETSFTKCINNSVDIIQLMTLNSHKTDISIFVGAHRRESENVFNSLYWINKGEIQSYYDKKIRMPFSEFVPFPWNQSSFLNDLFLKGWSGYAEQETLNCAFKMNDDFSFIPCICSDFYFDSTQRFSQYNKTHPILLTIGELWASTYYLQHLMHLYATYHAIKLDKDIIYVGYTRGCWINKQTGESFALYS